MVNPALDCYSRLQDKILQLPLDEMLFASNEDHRLRSQRMDQLIIEETESLDEKWRDRVRAEFHHLGPLETLIADTEITEILVNGPFAIWFEKKGQLHPSEDFFFSELSFRNAIDRLCQRAHIHLTTEHPSIDGNWGDFRLSLIGSEITRGAIHLSLRRHPKNPWTFEKLQNTGWCEESDCTLFQEMIRQKKSFLVIGSTGAGKTSVLNALLHLLPSNERVIAIEDTPELHLSNQASMRLLVRQDPQELLPEINQAQLVRRSLRLRPDRLVMGEIRGDEAKDFLMALATGHAGSFGTLHACSASQALIRLEMLIQMGAPQWSLMAIRRLIHLSLDYIVVTGRENSGKRIFKGLYRISSLEDHGFLTEQVSHL